MVEWPGSSSTRRMPPAASGTAMAELEVPKSMAQYMVVTVGRWGRDSTELGVCCPASPFSPGAFAMPRLHSVAVAALLALVLSPSYAADTPAPAAKADSLAAARAQIAQKNWPAAV